MKSNRTIGAQEDKNVVNRWWNDAPGAGLAPIGARVDFPALDRAVLAYWDRMDIFRRTISEREGCPDYVAYDGPPGTNGEPHIGNILQSALKDLWPRYYTMKGYRVLRKAGWDTHGLPIELTAERELGLKTKQDIINYGVDRYLEYCRSTVYRYRDAWAYAIKRIGRFLDTTNYYATMTPEYIQTGWWVLKQAWNRGLLYQGLKVVPWSPLSGTTLSSHEVSQGYRDVTDLSLYVKFPVLGKDKTFLVAWTTTAWTLLSNVALAVHPDLRYVEVEVGGERLIVAYPRLDAVAAFLGEHRVVNYLSGRHLEGWRYQPLWRFLEGVGEGAHRVVTDEYVTATDGTGVVHLALYGEDDFRIIQKHGLPMVQNVDSSGRCTAATEAYAGRYFREEGLDLDILKDLSSRGLLLAKEKITHAYPHNYKSGEPLMYFAKRAWFLKTSALKERMLAINETINWYPEHIKRGRFGNWLENNIDWAVSRERFWGTPLPVWTCQDCGDRVCVESLAELGRLRGEPLPPDFDPHKPFIDEVTFKCAKCGGLMKREPEVLDCWFDAGIMPWGQWGYPAAPGSADAFAGQYPADFICEAIDQTRGWFYTLLVASTLLDDSTCFKNVICTELITDAAGQKMSKSRGNVVNPVEVCDKFGADAVRWNFYIVSPWTARRFNESEVAECVKQVLIPYWNAYSFFVTYARVDKWIPETGRGKSSRMLDRWILSRLGGLVSQVTAALDKYDVTSGANAAAVFLDDLTNWFIRRSRRRFWKSEDDQDKRDAYQTLHKVLVTLNRLLAPFMPFVTEAVFLNLERGLSREAPDSVHLCRWPSFDDLNPEPELESRMESARTLVSIARSIRAEHGVRVRQPLGLMVAVIPGRLELEQELCSLILDELNVRKLEFSENADDLVSYRLKPNLKVLGPRLGNQLKAAADALAALDSETARTLVRNGQVSVAGLTFTAEEVIVEEVPREGFGVKTERGVSVGLDLRLSDDLRREWLARELVHTIQNLRKDRGLDLTDRISLKLAGDSELTEAVRVYSDYVCAEVLARSLEFAGDSVDYPEHNVAGRKVRIFFEPIRQGDN